ncbi:MAG: hypothetical protein Q8N62_01230 [Candidatus Omnitrophota bacterium]|nr:hypothetical protein [Candidatus Omnitrophota bacterium]
MAETNLTQIMGLKDKSLSELGAKYEELFPDQKAPSNNKALRPDIAAEKQSKNKCLSRDQRLPITGTVITKSYKGVSLQVRVLEVGFGRFIGVLVFSKPAFSKVLNQLPNLRIYVVVPYLPCSSLPLRLRATLLSFKTIRFNSAASSSFVIPR